MVIGVAAGVRGVDRVSKRDRQRPASGQQRSAPAPAGTHRADRRRQMMGWAGATVALVALVSAVAVAVVHRGGQAAAGASGGLGPEGIPLETGAPLASIGGAASGGTVDGIPCDASEQVAYHIHAHLAVFLNGASGSIPYGIGVVSPSVTDTP